MRLRTMVESIRRYFARLFGRSEAHAELPPEQAPAATQIPQDVPCHDKPPAASAARRSITLDSIFDRLEVMIAMGSYQQRMSGPISIGMSRVSSVTGTYIDGNSLNDYADRVEHIDSLGLPSAASVCLLSPDPDRTLGFSHLAKFTCAKIGSPIPGIERVSGPFYEGAATYIREPRKKRWGKKPDKGIATHVHLFFVVNEDGSVRLLKESGRPPSIVRMILSSSSDADPDQIERELAADTARFFNMFRQRDMNWIVRVKHPKRNVIATFGIGPLDAPSVFKDRVKTGTKTRRIFHPVRAHQRTTAAGVQDVPLHHRGLRQFVWRGFDCTIQIPHANTFMLSSVGLSARDGGGVPVHRGIEMLTKDMPMPRRAKAKKRA